jgi:hypothetical protein
VHQQIPRRIDAKGIHCTMDRSRVSNNLPSFSHDNFGPFFGHLDRFAGAWSQLEDTGRLIREVFSLDDLQMMLLSEKPLVREFGLIMVRLSLTDEVPSDSVAFLQELFTDYYDTSCFVERTYIVKVFLAMLLHMGHDLCQEILPTGIAHRIRACADGHFTDEEMKHYQEAITLLDENFEQE